MVNVLIVKVFFCCPNNKKSRYRLNLNCNLDQFALTWIALLVWKLTFLNTCQIVGVHVKWNTDTGSEVMHLGAAHHNLGTQSIKMWDWLKTVLSQYWRLLETLCWLFSAAWLMLSQCLKEWLIQWELYEVIWLERVGIKQLHVDVWCSQNFSYMKVSIQYKKDNFLDFCDLCVFLFVGPALVDRCYGDSY